MVGSGNHRVHARAEARLHRVHGCQPRASGHRRQRAGKAEVPGADARGRGQQDTNASERKTGVDGGAEPDERHKEKRCRQRDGVTTVIRQA